MRANIVVKTTAVLSLLAGLVASPLVAMADDGQSDSGTQPNAVGYDNSHAGEVESVDVNGLVVHVPEVFGTYQPGKFAITGGKPPLSYRGGVSGVGISAQPKVYLVFWGSQWGTTGSIQDASGVARTTFSNDPKGMAPYLQSFLAGLGTNGETWSQVLAQYCDGIAAGSTTCAGNSAARYVGYPAGGALAGVWYDNSAVAPTTASSAQLAAEAKSAAIHFGNSTPASNNSTQYVVVSATGMHPNGFNSPLLWCAWHNYATDATIGSYAYTNLPYLPDAGSGCGANFVNGADGALDGVSIVEGHEYAETVTDQWPAGGWLDAASPSNENGDLCAWTGPYGGQGGNLVLSTGTFAMQGTWSNSDNDCSMGAPNVISSGLPTAKTGSAYATTAISGGFTPYTYSSTSGSLPAGLTLGTDGRLTGTPATTSAGSYSYTVSFKDAKGTTSSGTINLTVATAIPTSVSLSASATSGTSTTAITLSAVLQAVGGSASSQTVTFKDGTTVLGTAVTDSNGSATLAARTFAGGSHSITASFAGTGLYLSSTSPTVTISIAAAVSSLVLNISPSTGITPTTTVTMTATISPVLSNVTISFYDGTTVLGTARTGTTGVATLAKTFAGVVGSGTSHSVKATFAGSTAATASTSNIVTFVSTIVAAGAPTAPTLTASTTTVGQATAKWTAPASNGGSAITGYNVYVYDSLGALAKTVSTTTTTTSTTITLLTSGKSYTFKVAAKTTFGEGALSAASNSATIK